MMVAWKRTCGHQRVEDNHCIFGCLSGVSQAMLLLQYGATGTQPVAG